MKAPNFKLKDNQGNETTLESFNGKKVILYFYPMDNTPGCTREACAFRDNHAKFEENNIVILGVSKNNKDSHNKFIKDFNLPFKLLIDKRNKVKKIYQDIEEEKSIGFFGKIKYNRMTFLIDENGEIIKMYKNVKVDGHIQEIINDLKIK